MHTSQYLIFSSYAKINLFLHIVGKRADGYHNLQTWFQFIDLKDSLGFVSTAGKSGLKLENTITMHHEKYNLIFKAFMAMRPFSKKQIGISIFLKKRIPIGAGLGGGSSNAATVLIALNKIWKCGLSQQELINIGAKLGADVPIFLFKQAAWAEGIGEKLTPKSYIEQYALIIKPNFHISTVELFSNPDLKINCPLLERSKILNIESLDNIFFELIKKKHSGIERTFQNLPDKNKLRLTGSGSCFYLLNPNIKVLLKNQSKLEKSVDSWIVKTLNFIPTKVS